MRSGKRRDRRGDRDNLKEIRKTRENRKAKTVKKKSKKEVVRLNRGKLMVCRGRGGVAEGTRRNRHKKEGLDEVGCCGTECGGPVEGRIKEERNGG